MREFNQPIKKWLPPVKLYLDDLKKIYEILAEKVESIKFKTEDYELEDINELGDLGNKLHNLIIKCSDPDITLEFNRARAKIYFDEDTEYNRAILSAIEAIILQRSNLLVRVLSNPLCFLFAIMLLLFSIFLISAQEDMTSALGWLSIVLLLFSIIASIMSLRYSFLEYSTIMLYTKREEVSSSKKEEAPSWKRKDLIIIAIMAAILGALIGSLITALVLGV
ncbi:MAG: hypothetical protein PVJ08_01880 [Dehalococcoidia bacterium]|jgi:hypothetical protein